MTTRVYRLDVTYPPGSDAPGWTPEGWDPDEYRDAWTDKFVWPRARKFLSRRGAEDRAKLLRSYGATVTVVPSDPVTWPDGGA